MPTMVMNNMMLNSANLMMMKNSNPMTMKAANSLSVFKAAGNKSSQSTRLMMKTAAASPYPTGTADHHLRIRDNLNSNKFSVAAAANPKPKSKAPTTTKRTRTRTTETLGLGDPCLDLFFGVKPGIPNSKKYRLLKQLLPAAWSHNPLTTLKLICNLVDDFWCAFGKNDPESFYRAAVWLHHNNPKTLASNVLSIFGDDSAGGQYDLAEFLYRLAKSGTRVSEADDYRLLRDRAADLYADDLRRNIEDMNKQEAISHYKCFIPEMDSAKDRATLLWQSIAKKFFPRGESFPEYQGLEDSLYTDAVRHRLRHEVLTPLNEYRPGFQDVSNNAREKYWDYCLKAEPGSLLPHEIIRYADSLDEAGVGVAQAQLKWERMVEDVHGKFKNCLVVCRGHSAQGKSHPRSLLCDVELSLAILVSHLSGGPWKAKVINSGPNPELHNLPSDLDLVSKIVFLRRMPRDLEVDIPKVFDLILQAAADANLRPDQMIKKVFLVTNIDFWHDWDYEAVVAKYKEKGYDQDAVPQMVFWRLHDYGILKVPRSRPGVATLTGFSNNLFKSFLDNDGQLGPRHVMEAAISEPQYQNLLVVD